MKSKLDLIETRLQDLIERGASLLLPRSNPEQTLARLLVDAMQESLITSKDERSITAPDIYHVTIHPERMDYWHEHLQFLDTLAQEIHQAGSEVGFEFRTRPRLQLHVENLPTEDDIKVFASFSRPSVSQTSGYNLRLEKNNIEVQRPVPSNAFLIVNGTRHVALTASVFNIGRRVDNQLVIDDPRVSRHHVQLRAINGSYVLFDLNSTGGTFINSQRISQAELNPGDVISLAGYPLIYGQDVDDNNPETDDRQSPGASIPGTQPLKL